MPDWIPEYTVDGTGNARPAITSRRLDSSERLVRHEAEDRPLSARAIGPRSTASASVRDRLHFGSVAERGEIAGDFVVGVGPDEVVLERPIELQYVTADRTSIGGLNAICSSPSVRSRQSATACICPPAIRLPHDPSRACHRLAVSRRPRWVTARPPPDELADGPRVGVTEPGSPIRAGRDGFPEQGVTAGGMSLTVTDDVGKPVESADGETLGSVAADAGRTPRSGTGHDRLDHGRARLGTRVR